MNTTFEIGKCECCGKDIKVMTNKKYCNKCRIYIADLKKDLSYYKRKYLLYKEKYEAINEKRN